MVNDIVFKLKDIYRNQSNRRQVRYISKSHVIGICGKKPIISIMAP